MKITKKVLCELDHCYAVSVFGKGSDFYFASESEGPCIHFDQNAEQPTVVWNAPGGTMSMVEIPDGKGDFLAVQKFLPTFDAAHAQIVWVHPTPDGGYEIHPFLDLPYVHRFDLLQVGEVTYFIGCTLCSGKDFVEDWSKPGKVYVGILPPTADQQMPLAPILENLTHNHGYCSGILQGKLTALVGCDEGVYALHPPEKPGLLWEIEHILDNPVGDLAIVDLDGDGKEELATIEPFHGKDFALYHQTEDGRYTCTYRRENMFEFGHTIWGGKLFGSPAILCGARAGAMELFCLRQKKDIYEVEQIDSGCGPSNIAVVQQGDAVLLCAANRQIGQAAVYLLEPEACKANG